jgi:glycine/D-amino acid oxidase-like deaminating enzyme
MNLSFWERESFFKDLDVVIIGSGIVGLNAALSLKKKQPALRILVLERGMLPMGASSKNAGFACFGSTSELLSDLENHNDDEVFSLVEKRWKGLLRLRKNLGDKNIDYQNNGGYEVFSDQTEYEKCASKLQDLNTSISKITGITEVFKNADDQIDGFGFREVRHMIVNKAEAQIDTGKMISALLTQVRSLGVEIINGFEVEKWEDDTKNVVIHGREGFHFKCRKLIIATNGFAKQLLPGYPVQPARAQVLVTTPVDGLKVKGTFHYDKGFYYFRNIGNRILFGGGRNLDFKTEETSDFGLTQIVQSKLEELLQTMILPYSKYSIDMRWSGIMGVGPQKKSIVQAVSTNVFCAVRMGGMGVAIGSLIGEDVAELCIREI